MTALSRAQALALAQQIRDETGTGLNTATRVGTALVDMIDSTVFLGEAETPPTAGNGLTGTTTFSVLPDGTSLTVGAAGVRLSDIAGNSVLGRAAATSGLPVALTAGTDGHALRLSGATLGFGTLATAAYADASVTLAKMANMATDSLLGRDTAGSGVPEVIGLNATLSMTGSGSLQRAALSGVVSAPAGSNTTAFASGDFGALNIITTGNIRHGSSPATTGDWRVSNAWTLKARTTVATDSSVFNFTNGDTLVIGDNTSPTYLNGGSLSLRVANSPVFTATSSVLTMLAPNLRWDQSQVSPQIIQIDETGNSINGDKLTIHAQNSTGTTTTGGALDIYPGSGTTAGGLGRLLSGSAAARYSWNDTGHAFFGATVAAQVADMGALTDSTGGTANGTLVDVGAAFSQATLNDNFADLAAKVTAIRNCLRTVGLMA